MIDSLLSVLLPVHIAAGFVSLLLFWVPIWSKKGGIDHRRIGRIYVRLMWLVVISAAAMSLLNLISGEVIRASFLGFLAILTARPLWLGVAVLKHKRNPSPGFQRAGLLINGLMVLASFALITYGYTLRGQSIALLMFAFGGLGLTALPELVRVLKSTEIQAPADWLSDHIGDMIISGIAAYTAFFAFGANEFTASLFNGNWATVPWLAPTVIGTLGMFYARKKFDRARA